MKDEEAIQAPLSTSSGRYSVDENCETVYPGNQFHIQMERSRANAGVGVPQSQCRVGGKAKTMTEFTRC